MNAIKIFVFILSISFIQAQEFEDYSARQLKKLAMAAERLNDSETAAELYEEYLEKKPSDFKVTYKLAESYRKIGSFKNAKDNYELIYSGKDKDKFPLAAFYYAEMLTATGKCKDAIPIYDQFRKDYRGEKDDRKFGRLAKFAVAGCENGDIDSNRISKFVIQALPNGINGEHIQGAPIYLDDGSIVYNSLETDGQLKFDIDEEEIPKRIFYTAKKLEDESWEKTGIWDVTKNFTDKEIANGSFNRDKSRFYFSACEVNDFGKVDCDIYMMQKEGGMWITPAPLGEAVNTKYTETQVAVGIDEKERETIYFVSDRKEGKGGKDIWYATYYEKKKTFKTARNCGSKINSVGDELTPFINPINRKLLFSSNGHPGNGGLDVFVSAGQRSRWTEPENIGQDINSAADELYYVLNPTGGEGLFASNRIRESKKAKGYCCDDLYYFKELNRIKLAFTGMVRFFDEESKTKKSVKEAKVKVYQVDPKTNETFLVQVKDVNSDGSFEIPVEADQKYVVIAEGDGFLTGEKDVSTKGMLTNRDITVDFDLELYKDKNIEIKNVYFKYGKGELTDDAKRNLDEGLVKIMKNNPLLIIEIGAHTDSKGSEGFNQNLSQQRADAVVKHMVAAGIGKERLQAKGYGESQPIAPNENPDGSDNPDGREKNRRVEMKVVGKLDATEEDDFDE